MGLGLQGAYGAAGGQDELQQLVAQRIKETLLRQQAEQQQAELALKSRGLDIDERQGDARIGIDGRRVDLAENQFGFEKDKWGEMAPQRAADLDFTGAQTVDLRRRPEAEEQARTHDVNMQGLRTTGRLREIGAQGAESRRTIQARPVAGGNTPGVGQSPYMQERNVRNLDSIDALMKKADGWTTGLGSLLANIPATDARDFAAELDTLKANIAFGELTAMREASKTGGALGQVSERELALLQSALGALDPGQSTENLKAQLQKIRDSIQRWEQAAQGMGGGSAQINRQNFGGIDVPGGGSSRVDELLKKYGGG